MLCSTCQHDNPTGARFCNACGAKLEITCPTCRHLNLPESRFCNACGASLATKPQAVASSQLSVASSQSPTPNPQPPIAYTPAHLAERIRAEQAAMEARGATDGERKTITALFADLKGSTALIEGLDPEEARAIIDPALQLMMDAVHRYEGYVAQALGDGIFALFGAPLAHEDHPQRALYAALLMQDTMRRYSDTLRTQGYPPLLMRVGVNTGEVVLRSIRKDDLHADYVPVGHSTNLAARMEQLAAPGSILVTAYTHKLTDGYFAFKELGQTQIKGVEAPLNIYEVAGVGPLRTKLQLSVRRGLARFIGRQSELDQLHRAWEQAKAGHGQISAVMGEPGVGKSRLFYEFKLLAQRGCLLLETFSVSHGKAYPYLPLIDLLKNYFQLTNQDDERQRREKITGKVLTLDRGLEDTLPYLFFLLGLAEPTSSLQQMDGQIRRQRILEAIKRLLLRESLNQPLLIIFEDLHWLDNETQAFLQLLSENVATARILLLVNYRPEYHHSWSGKTYFSQLRLDPLGNEQAEEMLAALLNEASESPLPRGERARERVSDADLQPLKRFILAKTEGNPFFMEELVQTLREQGLLTAGISRLTDLRLPTTVQGVLAARMDRLPTEEKALLQTLAVIGREFSSSLLRKVVTRPEDELHRLLSRLQAGEFVYEQPAFPEVEYIFKHALTQEVAYSSLLIERRKVLHERTAQAMEEVYHTRLEDHYSELAYHYSRSGNTQKAVDYLSLAGQQAGQRSAHAEAIRHLTSALELLKTLTDTSERIQQELTLQIALGVPLIATKGYGASEVAKAYIRARELCHQVDEAPPQLFSVLHGLYGFYYTQGELQTAHELGEQCLGLAQSVQDPDLLLEAHLQQGLSLYSVGEFAQAREHYAQGSALYTPQKHHSHAVLYGQDPGVSYGVFTAYILWQLGYPEQALHKIHAACALAQELSHPFSLALALNWAAIFHQFRREEQLTQARAEAAMTLSTEHGFPFCVAWGTILRGWARAEAGQGEEGITQMLQGLAAYRTTGAEVWRPHYLALLTEGYGKVGQPEEGLSVLAEALVAVNKTGERFYEAELYRLKGTLTLQQFNVQGSKFKVENPQSAFYNPQLEAEECFLKAIEIARKQQAKSLELRATMSLARLWQQQAVEHGAGSKELGAHIRLAEAHHMLAEIYNWFTEGFDTKDLQEAKALLEALA